MKVLVITFLILAGSTIFVGNPAAIQALSPEEALRSGIQAFRAHNFAAAENDFLSLVRVDPSATAYDCLAMAEAANGKLGRAIAHFQKSIHLGNNSSNVHYNLGLAYDQHGQPEFAIKEFRLAVSLDRKSWPARYALGITLLRSGRAQQAVDILGQARNQLPRDPRPWVALVEAQFEAGDAKQAVETAKDAMQAIPNSPRLAVTLASDCLRHQQVQTARDLLEDANELTPQNPEIRILLAKTSLLADEPVEALAVLRGMPPSGREQPERLNLMGEAHALRGNLTAAEQDLASAIKDAPNDAQYLTTYAWVQQLEGQHSAAILTLLKARALDPKTSAIPYRMAVSYYFLARYRLAQRLCGDALRLSPQDAAAYLLLGITQLRQNDIRDAVGSLRQAVNLNQSNGLFHRELGEALFKSGRLAAARRELDQALTLDPKDAKAYFWQAKLLSSEGAEQQAIASLNTAVEIRSDYSEAYGELARLYTKVGEPSRAAKTLVRQKEAQASSRNSREGLLRTLP